MVTDISLRGFIVGPIWWPAGAECFKPLSYSITRESKLLDGGTLRDHVLRATNDGDFQHATLALAEIVIERRTGSRRVIRSFPLSHFPSVADCLHPDGEDWCPQSDLDGGEG
jgi:hypothetical protein